MNKPIENCVRHAVRGVRQREGGQGAATEPRPTTTTTPILCSTQQPGGQVLNVKEVVIRFL